MSDNCSPGAVIIIHLTLSLPYITTYYHLVHWLLSTWHYHYLISQHIITYSSQLSSGAGVLSRSLLCYCQTLESSKVHVTSKMILKDILGICKHWFGNFTLLKSFRRINIKLWSFPDFRIVRKEKLFPIRDISNREIMTSQFSLQIFRYYKKEWEICKS